MDFTPPLSHASSTRESMQIGRALSGVVLERSDAEVLLSAALHVDRAFLHAHPEHMLPPDILSIWNDWVARRIRKEPIAYITGSRSFYGRDFLVDPRVHIPRPSTENLIGMTIDFLKDPCIVQRPLELGIIGVACARRSFSHPPTIIDIGTGSGCIAITLALEIPDSRVIAVDISSDALDVARENAKRLGANVSFVHGDLLAPFAYIREPFIVVSNPPYLCDESVLPEDVAAYEPRIALRGGNDGGSIIRTLKTQMMDHPYCRGWVIECLESQRALAMSNM